MSVIRGPGTGIIGNDEIRIRTRGSNAGAKTKENLSDSHEESEPLLRKSPGYTPVVTR